MRNVLVVSNKNAIFDYSKTIKLKDMNVNMDTNAKWSTSQKIGVSIMAIAMIAFFIYAGYTIHQRGW